MQRFCPDCQHSMVNNCQLESPYGIGVRQRRKGLFKSVTSNKVKAAVCTNCGHVTLYVENYEEYKQ
jgi:uncharacterized OB-fold protein